MFSRALCRRPSATLGRGLTTAGLGTPDPDLALRQHDAYVNALRELGLDVTVLAADDEHPDAHFVEDTAIVTPRVAILCRPGHPSRRGEVESVEAALSGLIASSGDGRPLERITAPGTVDGGDVLMLDDHFLIGVSERTNREGADQLGAILERHGHTWQAVPVAVGLHFKSSVSELGKDRLLVTADFAERPELAAYDRLVVPPGEEYAANTLHINGRWLTPAGFDGTLAELKRAGGSITTLDLSEMRKMDGGLSCLSLRF